MSRKADYYSRLARKHSYPARSVFKLQEMQERFGLLKAGQRVLDLGSAPGSWSRYCLQRLGSRGFLAAVDLEPAGIEPPPAGAAYRFIQGDIFSEEIFAVLGQLGSYDLILSDAAPRTSGSGLVDAAASLRIAERALQMAVELLAPAGHLVVKVFQGGEEGQLLGRMRGLFRRARAFKPAASRRESRETYFLGLFLKSKVEKKA
jgi:23S rRNA (uridine2552-2'-O)-methyltransferase